MYNSIILNNRIFNRLNKYNTGSFFELISKYNTFSTDKYIRSICSSILYGHLNLLIFLIRQYYYCNGKLEWYVNTGLKINNSILEIAIESKQYHIIYYYVTNKLYDDNYLSIVRNNMTFLNLQMFKWLIKNKPNNIIMNPYIFCERAASGNKYDILNWLFNTYSKEIYNDNGKFICNNNNYKNFDRYNKYRKIARLPLIKLS
jgi:hypothetical protein